MSGPLFSLITPVLNAAGTVADTIASVRLQDFDDFEWIVQDGGSTDGGILLWKDAPGVQLEVCADSGLYDAMNKAVARSRGKWLVFLQADDWLEPGALRAFADAALAFPDSEVLAGGSSAVCGVQGEWRSVWERNASRDKILDFSSIALGEPMLNARAYRRELWQQMGGFNTRWSLAADRAWLLELARRNPEVATVVEKIYRYRWHDGSKTMNAGNALSTRLTRENMEIAEALQRHCEGEELRVLKAWHTGESTRLAMNQLEAFAPGDFLGTLLRGTKFHAPMIFHFAAELLRSLPGFLLRGGKTKSAIRRQDAFVE